MIERIRGLIQESIKTKEGFLTDANLTAVSKITDIMIRSIQSGGKILACGNGGSASDAMHFVGELVGRFQTDRPALAAVALNSDVATMTAIANDMGFDQVFTRQVEAVGRKGDVLLILSTSGNSKNQIYACEAAKRIGIGTVGLLGRDGGKMKSMLDACIVVDSKKSARIQEVHITVIHIICEIIEDFFYERNKT